MEIQKCTRKDITELAIMNNQLIEDERCDNKKLTVHELEERMQGFITGDYDAYFFIVDSQVVGYGLVDKVKSPLYLRHFLIKREYRRKSYGKEAFQALLEHLGADSIDIEVYSWNERGIGFWESCGFKERCKYMRYSK
jgi:ribosomal protein S18 acetylase RimI-like enzyme